MEKQYNRGNLEFTTDYVIRPRFRMIDLGTLNLFTNQGNFTVRGEGGFVDQPMMTVTVWEDDKLLLEKQYDKLDDVFDIVNDLPECHPVEYALYELIAQYEQKVRGE